MKKELEKDTTGKTPFSTLIDQAFSDNKFVPQRIQKGRIVEGKILKKEKIRYELTSMGTNMEGNLRDLIRIALKMHQTPFKKGALRVVTALKIDDRRDKKGTLEGKKRAVENKLKRKS